METIRHAPTPCPKCGYVVDCAGNPTGGGGQPREGDLSVCIECGSVLAYEAGMTLRLLTQEEWAGLPPEVVRNVNKIREAITAVRYNAQLEKMAGNAKAWRAANPERVAKVQFNFPPGVAVIQSLSEAVKMGMVSANEAGLELLKALWPWDDRSEPTVLMVRAALEAE